MNKLAIVSVSFLTAILSASAEPTVTNKTIVNSDMVSILQSELSKLDLINPEKDLDRNLVRGDIRFIGIYGYTLYSPGTDNLTYDEVKQYGIRPINGTSDCIMGGEHRRLIQAATDYATRYNQALIQRLPPK